MIKTLITSLKIECSYSVNGIIYYLRKLPFLKNVIREDAYCNKTIKVIATIISIILALIKQLAVPIIYFYLILMFSSSICPKYESLGFVHIYFCLAMLGLFINNKLLTTSVNKYLSIVVFNIDSDRYLKTSLWFDLIKSIFLNTIGFLFINLFIHIDIIICVVLIITSFMTRLIGEGWNIWFYKKNGYQFNDNLKLYFLVVLLFMGACFLPYFTKIYILRDFIIVYDILLAICSVFSIKFIYSNHDYKLIYKRLNTLTRVMNEEEKKSYSRQAMVEVKDKDKIIDNKKIKDKKGFDLFNIIFFERHKEILTRSLKRYSLIIIGIYIVFIILMFNGNINSHINEFLLQHLGAFVIIMFFINRGSIITQAMFYNCDHAMLTYNFYRNPDIILKVFKKRLITLSKLNLLPAIIISIGNCILLFLSGGASIITYISIFVFIICLSIFFSVHYLVLYYLCQPYNKDLKIKKFSYTIICLLTYIVSYNFINFVFDSTILGLLFLLFTIIYVLLGCFLVYKFSYKTFKINQ